MNPSQNVKNSGRRSSILKPPKVRNPLSDLDVKTEHDITVTRSTRRVSFASNNTIKPFKIDNDKNTVWDSTYEEEVTPSDVQTSSNQNQDTVGSNIDEFMINVSRNPSLVPSEVASVHHAFNEENLSACPLDITNVECSFISDIPTEKRIITEGNKLIQDTERQCIMENILLTEATLPQIKDIAMTNNICKPSVTQNTYVNKSISEQKKLSLPGLNFNPFLKLSTVKKGPHTFPMLNRYSVATSTQKLGDNIKKNNDENIHPILGTKQILQLNSRSSKQQISTTLSLKSKTVEQVSVECKQNKKEVTFFSKSVVKTNQNVLNSQNDQSQIDNSGFSSDMELTDEIPMSVIPLTAIDNKANLIQFQNNSVNLIEKISVSETQMINSQNNNAKTTHITDSNIQSFKNENQKKTTYFPNDSNTIKELSENIAQPVVPTIKNDKRKTIHFDHNDSEANMEITEHIVQPVVQSIRNEKRKTMHFDHNDSEANMEITEHIVQPVVQSIRNEKRKTIHFDHNDSEANMEITEHVVQPVVQSIRDEKRKTIHFDHNDSEDNMEITEHVVQPVVQSIRDEKRKTIHFDNNDSVAKVEITGHLAQPMVQSFRNENHIKTVYAESQDSDDNMEMTEVIVEPVLQSVINTTNSNTTHFENSDSEANMEITEHIAQPVVQSFKNENQTKTAYLESQASDASMKINEHNIIQPVLQSLINEKKNKTINFDIDNSEANMEMTEDIAQPVQFFKNENQTETVYFENKTSEANKEMTEHIAQPVLQSIINENKIQTIHFDKNDSDANMEMTEHIAQPFVQSFKNKHQTKVEYFERIASDGNMEITEHIVQPVLQSIINENKIQTIHFDNNDSEANMEMTEHIAHPVVQSFKNIHQTKVEYFERIASEANMEMTEHIAQPVQFFKNENQTETVYFKSKTSEANKEMTEHIAQPVVQSFKNKNQTKAAYFESQASDANMEMTEHIAQPFVQSFKNKHKTKAEYFERIASDGNMEITEHIAQPVLQSIINENKIQTIHFDNNDSEANMEMTEHIAQPVVQSFKNKNQTKAAYCESQASDANMEMTEHIVQPVRIENKRKTIHFDNNDSEANMEMTEHIAQPVVQSFKNKNQTKTAYFESQASDANMEMTEHIAQPALQSTISENKKMTLHFDKNDSDANMEMAEDIVQPVRNENKRKTIHFDNNDSDANMEMTEHIAQPVVQSFKNKNQTKAAYFESQASDANMEMTEHIAQPALQSTISENKRMTLHFDKNDSDANMEMAENIVQPVRNENKRKTIHFDNNDSDANMEFTEIIRAPVMQALKNENIKKINLDNLSVTNMSPSPQISVPRVVNECNSSHPNLEQPKQISSNNKKGTIHFNVNKLDVSMKAIAEIPLKHLSVENKEKLKNNDPNLSNKITVQISNSDLELTEPISVSATQPYSNYRINEHKRCRTHFNLKDSQTELLSPKSENKRRKTESDLISSQILDDQIHKSEFQSFSIKDKKNIHQDDNEKHCDQKSVFGLETNSIFVTDKFSYEKKELNLKNSQNDECIHIIPSVEPFAGISIDIIPAVDPKKKDITHEESVFSTDLDNHKINLIEEKNERLQNTSSKSALNMTCNFEQCSTLMESTQALINAKTSLTDTLKNNLSNSCTALNETKPDNSYSLSENKNNLLRISFGESVSKLLKSDEENVINFNNEVEKNFEHDLVIEKVERRTVEKAQSPNLNDRDCSTNFQRAEVCKIIDDKTSGDNENLENPVIVISDDSDSSSGMNTPLLKEELQPEENYRSLVTNLENKFTLKPDDDATKQNISDNSVKLDINEGAFMGSEISSTNKNKTIVTDYSIHDFSAFAFKQDSLIMLEKTTIDLVNSDTEDDASLKVNNITSPIEKESLITTQNPSGNAIINDYNIEMENRNEFVLEQNQDSNFKAQTEKNMNEHFSQDIKIKNELIESSTRQKLPAIEVSNDFKLSKETADVERELSILESIRQQQTRKDCLWKILLNEKTHWSFSFLYGTLRLTLKLNVSLTENHQLVNNIYLESCLKETADTDCHFTHYLLMKKFSPEKLLSVCSDTKKVLDVLTLISEEVKLMEHLNNRMTYLSLRYGMTFDRNWRAVFSIVSVNLRIAMEVAVDCSNWGDISFKDVIITKLTKNGDVTDVMQIARSIKCDPNWLEHFVKNSHDYIDMLETCT